MYAVIGWLSGLEKRTNPTYLERLVKADKRLGLRHEIVKAIGG